MSATVREKPLARKVSEARRIAEATELGKQLGDYRGRKRKPLEVSLKEHIGKFLDRLRADDIIKITAWIGLAYLIKPVLQANAEVSAQVALSKAKHYGTPEPGIGGADQIARWLTTVLLKHPDVTPEQAESISEDIKKADLEFWLLALATSALIITFGPSILQSIGGIGKLGSLLLL